jgi:putative tricarboxylic transport membrane protein
LYKFSGFHLPLKDFIGNIGNIIRSFFIGLWIGFLPGLGGSLANVVAYATQKNFSKHPETFGKGNIEGVWAPEVANNASVGGAYIPMVTLGIPGDGPTAYLLMGLIIAGIDPGPLLMRTNPVLVYMIFAATIFSAVYVLLLEIFGMKLFPSILRAPYHYLYPAILAFCFTGAYIAVGNISAIVILIGFTMLGVWFAYANIPHVPFVLAFVLGDILEQNFRSAVNLYPQYGVLCFFVRPLSCGILILLVLLLFWPAARKAIMKRNARVKAVFEQVQDDD